MFQYAWAHQWKCKEALRPAPANVSWAVARYELENTLGLHQVETIKKKRESSFIIGYFAATSPKSNDIPKLDYERIGDTHIMNPHDRIILHRYPTPKHVPDYNPDKGGTHPSGVIWVINVFLGIESRQDEPELVREPRYTMCRF